MYVCMHARQPHAAYPKRPEDAVACSIIHLYPFTPSVHPKTVGSLILNQLSRSRLVVVDGVE